MSAPVVIGYRVATTSWTWKKDGVRLGGGTSWNFVQRAQALARVRREVDRGCEAHIARIVIPEAL